MPICLLPLTEVRVHLPSGVRPVHLTDIETGKVIEFRSEKIEQLQAGIAAERGYEIVRHRLELYGCPLAKSLQPRRLKASPSVAISSDRFHEPQPAV